MSTQMSPAQCRAARALLNWTQLELSGRARIAKKTVADFERDARTPHPSTSESLRATLEAAGVEFIPEIGGGAGVRFRKAMPRLIRRGDQPDGRWLFFVFDYKNARYNGAVDVGALALIALQAAGPVAIFDRDTDRILLVAAKKVDDGELDPEGRVLILRGELKRVPFNF